MVVLLRHTRMNGKVRRATKVRLRRVASTHHGRRCAVARLAATLVARAEHRRADMGARA